MVRRRLSLKETTSTFMLNLQNHRQCPAGGFLLLGGRRPGWLRGSLKAGSGIGRIWTAARAGAAIPQEQGKAPRLSRRTTVSRSPSSKPRFQSLQAQGLRPEATDRVTATPQCLRKRSAFGNLMAALFMCCGAGTYFVHLSFRVKSAFALKS